MILKIGMQSPDVLNLERVLQGLNFTGFEADGFFDQKTENVIRYIQRSNGLREDGIVGDQTFAVIDRLFEVDKPNFSSSNFLTTQQVQTVLAEAATPSTLPKVLQGVHSTIAQKALQMIELAKQEGYQIQVTQGLRTFAQQDKLYKQRPKVTNAPGGFSFHNYGIAVDFCFIVGGDISWDEKLYKNLGRWASRVGLEWGGNWKFSDKPHCQLPNMTSIRALLSCYQSNGGGEKGILAVWKQFVR